LTDGQAAKIVGCQKVICIDRVKSRLELAKTLGASDCLDTSSADLKIVEEVKKLTGGEGSNIVIDTTGVPALIEAGLEFTASRGKLIFIGVPPNDYSLSVHVITALKVGRFQFQHVHLPKQNISKNRAANAHHSQTGRFIIGSIEGDSVPEKV
jgi:threonine dehydrogenase-like Zn-dependent dehydrogenase